jgi:hypothetical protein
VSMRTLPSRSDRPRVGAWMFVIAWFVGNLALIAGFEGARGSLQEVLVLCVLAIACAVWWGAYRMSKGHNRGGFIVIALWMLSFIVPILDFHYYVRDLFFWGSTVMIVSLAAASGLSRPSVRQLEPPE